MKIVIGIVSLVSLLWQVLPASTAAYAQPLKIVSKTEFDRKMLSGDYAPRVRVALRNESTRTITAWSFSCLYATNDGNASTATVTADSYRTLMYNLDRRGAGPLLPGEFVEYNVPKVSETISGYGAMACRVDGVIFDDGTGTGDSTALESLFDSRSQEAAELAELIRRIEEARAASKIDASPEAALDVLTHLHATAGMYTSRIAVVANKARLGEKPARSLLSDLARDLRSELDLMQQHLRK